MKKTIAKKIIAKKIIWCVVVISLVLCAVVAFFHHTYSTIEVGTFSINDYQSQINTYTTDTYLGKIENAYVAIEQAEALFGVKFGKELGTIKTYEVSYDSSNDIWLVRGRTLPPLMVGGEPHIIIRGCDGRVLAIWHTK